MSKKLHILALAALMMGAPALAMAEPDREPETELNAVSVTINGTSVHVSGAQGMDLLVYNLAGVKIATIHIDSNDKTFNVNLQKGCYIVKVGKVARKISVK